MKIVFVTLYLIWKSIIFCPFDQKQYGTFFALSPFVQTKTYSLNMTRPSSIHRIVCSFEHIGQPNVKRSC
jgi:hypothetical protein